MTRLRVHQRHDVASACDAFLSGTYAEYLLARDAPVPTWVWLNVLAHGTVERLTEVAGGLAAAAHVDNQWLAARSFLAGDVLDLVGGDGPRLAALQSAVLWPWELDVGSRRGPTLWVPADLVTSTMGAIRGRVYVRP